MPRHEITSLREQRTSVLDQMRALTDTAESEERDLSAEEYQTYEQLEGEFDSLGRRADRLEREEGLVPQMARPDLGSDGEPQERAGVASEEYRDAFVAFIRAKGHTGDMRPEQRAALAVGTDSAGGYTVPDEFSRTLVESEREFGVMRQLARVVTTGNDGDLLIPTVATRSTAAWTAEAAAYTESEPTFGQVKLGSHKVGAISKISDELSHDSAFDLLGFLARDLGEALGVKENTSFVTGADDSTTTPKGLATLATSGVTASSTTAVATDELIDLYHSIISPYRSTAVWLMHDDTAKAIRKLKDSNNQYLWQPGLQAGQPDMLLNRPVHTDPDMAKMAASAKPILFGDIARAYTIRDVIGITVKVLVELYAANGQIGVRAERRTDGNIVDTAAVRALTNAAS